MFLLGSSFNFQTILIIMIFVIAFTLITNLYKSIQKKKQLAVTKPIMKTQLRCEKCGEKDCLKKLPLFPVNLQKNKKE